MIFHLVVDKLVDYVACQSGRTELGRMKLKVLQFLGELGGCYNQYVVNCDVEEILHAAVSWSTTQHIKFDMPFKDVKADIYLGKPHSNSY